MASTNAALLLLVLVALAGIADLPVAAAARQAMDAHPVTAKADPELDGMMQCMMGCFTTVMSCAFGCMGKGPDLPLCVISCDQKSVVCMIRCGLTPSPPGPAPPAPTPKPPSPKPPAPAPAPGPPYAAHNTEN